jgi:host factor-I protein
MLLKNPSRPRRKDPPPGETGQEVLYLRFLSEKQVPVTVKLRDGEAVYGWIEYFDDRMIRLTREGKPNLFIYKDQIRTISESFRSIEARRRERNRSGKDKTPALPPGAAPGAAPAVSSSAKYPNHAPSLPSESSTDTRLLGMPRPSFGQENQGAQEDPGHS